MGDPGILVDVSLRRGGRTFALRLASGARRIGVSGPSGAGKTTLLRVLAGLEPAAEGRVVVGGCVLQDGAFRAPPWDRGVGWVPQEATLFPHASVLQNLCWARPDQRDALGLADALGLGPLLRRRPRFLSSGERQRVALGRALLARPRMLLLDEPFSALDKELREGVIGIVADHVARLGARLVLVSHERADLLRLCEQTWEARTDGTLRVAAS